ncbi:MAG: helix-turn-helix domain-containing protein [Bacteroidales bacterium]|nr:helix-turn-helix domain-containing protein [Bacteroidales bacterium]
MGWFRITLSDEEQTVVQAERENHPEAHVRRKMLVLWLLHCGLTREKAGEIAGLGRATVQRYVAAYQAGGLDGLRQWNVTGPVSDLVAHTETIRESLTQSPVRTIAEACERIASLTGIERKPTQVRKFLVEIGFRVQRGRGSCVAPPERLKKSKRRSNSSKPN